MSDRNPDEGRTSRDHDSREWYPRDVILMILVFALSLAFLLWTCLFGGFSLGGGLIGF
jgi:hypothetical protein